MTQYDTRLPAERLIAHRGQLRDYPENSLAALAAAVEAGALAIEVDVQMSADCVPLLYHDSTLQRISGIHGAIREFDSDALLRLPAHEPGRLGERFRDTKIAALAQLAPFLARHPQLTCYVEMKPSGIDHCGAARCWQALAAALDGVLAQCVFISFDAGFLREVRLRSGCRSGIIVTEAGQLAAAVHACDIGFCDIKLLADTADLADLPLPVAVYEVPDAAGARHWLARGATLVETHDIAGVLANRDRV
jgi:glycerophosphoryl diester phosphodiesterase